MNEISKLKAFIIMAGLGLLVVGLSLIGLSAVTSQKKERLVEAPVVQTNNDESTRLLANQLNDIQIQLSALQRAVQKPQKTINLKPIQQEINKLSHVVESVKVNGDGTAQRLMGENKELAQKVESVSLSLARLNQSQQSIQYLDPKSLPFKVLAIDNIQEQAVAAIEYNFHPIALEKGDEVAGWKVVNLDYAHQVAEFENKDKAHVQLSLTQVG